MSVSGVILAAGSGTRFGARGDKVWALLSGQPVLAHSIQAFASSGVVDELVVALRAEDEPRIAELSPANVPLRVVSGGPRRVDSARAALAEAIADYVLIHDGARPLVTPELIRRVLDATIRHGAAVPVVAVRDTVRYARNGSLEDRTVDRTGLVLIQTPQGFRRDLLLRAYSRAERDGRDLPDDAAAVLALGHPVATVPGAPTNLKVTGPEDLGLAERLLSAA